MRTTINLPALLRQQDPALTLNMIEIGARPVDGQREPFHALLEQLPGSCVHAFEVDSALCEGLNASARPGLRYHPIALGRADEERHLYETTHPMCTSLYRPNDALLDLYHHLEVARLRQRSTVRTQRLDEVARRHDLGPIDFIKIDVQGAEVDIFRGAENVLGDVLAVVSEVSFAPLYHNQPLFGDVCAELARSGLTFQRFLGVAGRALRPIVINNDPNHAVRHLWADALFTREPQNVAQLRSQQLLKLALLLNIYGSPDGAYFMLAAYDARNGAQLAERYLTEHTGNHH